MRVLQAGVLPAAPVPSHLPPEGVVPHGAASSPAINEVFTELLEHQWMPPYLRRVCLEVLEEDMGRSTWIWCPDFLLEQYVVGLAGTAVPHKND